MTLTINPLHGLQFLALLDPSEIEEDTSAEFYGGTLDLASRHFC